VCGEAGTVLPDAQPKCWISSPSCVSAGSDGKLIAGQPPPAQPVHRFSGTDPEIVSARTGFVSPSSAAIIAANTLAPPPHRASRRLTRKSSFLEMMHTLHYEPAARRCHGRLMGIIFARTSDVLRSKTRAVLCRRMAIMSTTAPLVSSSAPPGLDSAADVGAALRGWKKIAALPASGRRTVQRWERNEHLPVHRQLHLKLGTVHAVRVELDEWLANRTSPGAGTQTPFRTRDPRAYELYLRGRQLFHQFGAEVSNARERCSAVPSLSTRNSRSLISVLPTVAPISISIGSPRWTTCGSPIPLADGDHVEPRTC